jgi:hypothetical protein
LSVRRESSESFEEEEGEKRLDGTRAQKINLTRQRWHKRPFVIQQGLKTVLQILRCKGNRFTR